MKKLFISLFIFHSFFCLNLRGVWAAEPCWNIPTITGNFQYAPGWFPPFQWNPDNQEVVGPGSNIMIGVINGEPNFTWRVVGTDFWFDADYTLIEVQGGSRSITLYAGPSACGAAKITIRDALLDIVVGYVRSTAGNWLYNQKVCDEGGLASSICWGQPIGHKRYRVVYVQPVSGYASCAAACSDDAINNAAAWGLDTNACKFFCGGPNSDRSYYYKNDGGPYNGFAIDIEEYLWTCQ